MVREVKTAPLHSSTALGLQTGAFSCPHSQEDVTAPLMQEKQASYGDLQTPLRIFSFCTFTCVTSQKKETFQVLTSMKGDETGPAWHPHPPLWPISDWDMQHPLLAQLWFTFSYKGSLKWVNASLSPFMSFFQFVSAPRNKFRLHLIKYSSKINLNIWLWPSILTTLSSNTSPNLTTTETPAVPLKLAFSSALSQLCHAICCCFHHLHSKSLHTSLFMGSSHHSLDGALAFPPDQHHCVLSCWNHTNDSHSLICSGKWFSKTGLMPL